MSRTMRRWVVASAVTTAVLLASCAQTIPITKRQAARLERYEAYAGKPISQFIWLTHYHRWTALAPHTLAFWTNINTVYLITVHKPCANLLFANGIAVTSHAGVVQAHFDFVDARGFHCMIDTIQPLDVLRMQRDRHKK
jgi:hypothetical protein